MDKGSNFEKLHISLLQKEKFTVERVFQEKDKEEWTFTFVSFYFCWVSLSFPVVMRMKNTWKKCLKVIHAFETSYASYQKSRVIFPRMMHCDTRRANPANKDCLSLSLRGPSWDFWKRWKILSCEEKPTNSTMVRDILYHKLISLILSFEGLLRDGLQENIFLCRNIILWWVALR